MKDLAPLLLEDLDGCSQDEAVKSLSADFEQPDLGIKKLLIAYVSVGSWGCDSSAWVLFVGHDGELYEVSGSHCSCHGFEGQWEPEKSSVDYLLSSKFGISAGGYDGNAEQNKRAIKERIAELFAN